MWNVTTLSGSGAQGWTDGQATAAKFWDPSGVAVDPATLHVYVGDLTNHRVRLVSPTGYTTTLAGSGSPLYAEGIGTAASLKLPNTVRISAPGALFVTDSGNNRLRRILPSGSVVTVAGNSTASGVDGIGTLATFNEPTDIALDSSGTLGYIVEQIGCKIRRINLATRAVSTLAGSGVCGFFDSPNGLLAQFNKPTNAAWHPGGFLYIGEMLSHRVRRLDIASSAVVTFAGNGIAGGGDGIGTVATFNQPRGVTLDPTLSALYVADFFGHRIRSISLSTATVRTIAGSGIASYSDGIGLALRSISLCHLPSHQRGP